MKIKHFREKGCEILNNSRFHTKYFAVLSSPMELRADRVHTGISSLREDYANEAAHDTSSSALGLLAGRKQLHGVYCHLESPAGKVQGKYSGVKAPIA